MQKLLLSLLTLFLCIGVNAQHHIVQGQVTDSYGPVYFITVIDKTTKNKTLTDLDGLYSIRCTSSSTLEYSGLAYKTHKESVRGREIINVTLEYDNPPIVIGDPSFAYIPINSKWPNYYAYNVNAYKKRFYLQG